MGGTDKELLMPAKEHRKVAKSARKAGLRPGSKRYSTYVYGTLDKIDKAKKAKRRRKK